MKRLFGTFAISVLVLVLSSISALAQQERMTITGSALIFGTGANTRSTTRTFTMNINGSTSSEDVQRYLTVLQDGNQDDLLRAIRRNNLGSFSLGGSLGPRLNAVVSDQTEDGKTRIRIVFERWMNLSEVRFGYRSRDYPFSYIEVIVDPKTGRGEGTYFQAARIRARANNTVEIEDFGTFPSRLMGVRLRRRSA
ncbi:MAG: hypothetical protein KA746_10025 [Pyrinomonadaceae bacterium]|nr:hypothetical protein [Pyrinomonadaceae bacterium]MBP6214296.1 hypothetical protein [Pyrinomonadaceae bacterium]